MGPPGSGKDTQAELLEEELGLHHVQTSKLIEAAFEDPNQDPEVIKTEKDKWASGELNSRNFVNTLILQEIRKSYTEGKGIIFSGSPRDIEEVEVVGPLLGKLYGTENVKTVRISLSEEESVKRNSHRRMCQAHRHPIPNFKEYENIMACPKDGSPIVTRILDNPETIKKRYQVYLAQTKPVFDFLEKIGYNILEVDGEQPIEDIHREILNKLW